MANFIGTSTSYDCSACEEGGVFDSVQSVTAEEGDYDLLSVDGTGHTPTSVLFDGEDSSGGASSFSQKLKGEHWLNEKNGLDFVMYRTVSVPEESQHEPLTFFSLNAYV